MKQKKRFRRVWTAAALSLLICILGGTPCIYAGDWEEKDASAAAGYYQSEEESLVLMGNGTMFVISSSDGEMQVRQFTVQSDGPDMIITAGEDKYVLAKQNDKEKTESGGTYYAFYKEYAGNASEVNFKEGKQIQFDDEIFNHDYQVMVREPLSVFFGVESDQAYAGDSRTEGVGFDTPDEAVSAYIEGLCNGNIRQMLSACAVESYVEGFDLEAFVERNGRLQAFLPTSYLPAAGDLSEGINLETRKYQLNSMIKFQYLTLCGSKTVVGEDAMQVLTTENTSAEDLIRDYLPTQEPDITFSGEIVPPSFFDIPRYYAFFNQRSIASMEDYNGAEQSVDRAAVVYVDGKTALVILGVNRYDGRWFITDTSYLTLFLGVPVINGGAIPLYMDEELLSEKELIDYLADPAMQLALNTGTQELEKIDMKPILSLDQEEQEAAYMQEVENAISRLPSQYQELFETILDY